MPDVENAWYWNHTQRVCTNFKKFDRFVEIKQSSFQHGIWHHQCKYSEIIKLSQSEFSCLEPGIKRCSGSYASRHYEQSFLMFKVIFSSSDYLPVIQIFRGFPLSIKRDSCLKCQ